MTTAARKTFATLLLFICFATAAMSKSESGRFRASFMVAEPTSATVQAQYGHAFIRLEYPAEGLDFCFTLESDNDDEHVWNIAVGNYHSDIMAFLSDEYLKKFAMEGRMVAQLPLNLKEVEIQNLWRMLDEKIMDKSQNIAADYFTHGCSAELARILFANINGDVVFDEEVLDSIGRTYMQAGYTYRPRSSWSLLAAAFCFAKSMQEERAAKELAYLPVAIPFMFSHARIVDADGERQLLFSTEATLYKPDGKTQMRKANQVRFFAIDTRAPIRLYIIIYIALHIALLLFFKKMRKPMNIVMFSAYNLIMATMLLTSSLTSIKEFTGWNWLYLFYNPLPLLLWLRNCRKPFSTKTKERWMSVAAAWSIACVAGMALMGGMIATEITFISATFAIQLVLNRFAHKQK